MKYLVHVSVSIEVDAGSEDEATEKAADELRGYKPKEFSFDVTPGEETPSEPGEKLEIKREVIELKLFTSKAEVGTYGVEGVKQLWTDILERYASEEYYDPDLVKELVDRKADESQG